MRRSMALTATLAFALAFCGPLADAAQPKGPDEGRKVTRLQPKTDADFPGGKVVAMQGSTGDKGHYYIIENLATTQPVTVTLAAQNKGDDIRVAIYKKDWKDVKREGTTGDKGVAVVKFRTHGDARIQVSAKGAAKPYRMLVAVGDDVKPRANPAFMPEDEYQRKHPK